jgi:uncharacterized protein (TIGR02453 family)
VCFCAAELRTPSKLIFMKFFTKKSFEFLSNLELNNNKSWFIENKSTYDSYIISPIKELVSDLGMFIMTIDHSLETKPVINKAISRIYRDTRYSNSKLPFKDNIGFNFRRKCQDWKCYPSFLFRITPSGYIFGLVIVNNNPEYFLNFRNDIDNNETSFQDIVTNISLDKDLELHGSDYKKFIYNGENKELQQWYCKRNIFIRCCRDKNYYTSKKELILDVRQKFNNLYPAYKYFNKIFTREY